MTRIPENDRDIIEQALYLPMVITVLEKDRKIFEKGPFKLNQPYVKLVEESLKKVRSDLAGVRNKMRLGNMKIQEVSRDESFTSYLFVYKGYEEQHNYFNPRLRNKCEELLNKYLKVEVNTL